MQGHFVALAALLLVPVLSAPAADLNAGVQAARRGDYAAAQRELRPLAEEGNAVAQFNMGIMYAQGHGVKQDKTQAVAWFRKAAEQELVQAQAVMGTIYARGMGVEQDNAEAVRWYLRAAEQNDPGSQHDLGVLYANGQGVPKDYSDAYFWFAVAAAQDYGPAKESKAQIRRYMVPAQVIMADERVNEWLGEQIEDFTIGGESGFPEGFPGGGGESAPESQP